LSYAGNTFFCKRIFILAKKPARVKTIKYQKMVPEGPAGGVTSTFFQKPGRSRPVSRVNISIHLPARPVNSDP